MNSYFAFSQFALHQFYRNRPPVLKGHVTNASFKQWVGILLMPKINRAHKNYLTPEIWEETHLREIFYGTLIFQQSSMICIGRHVEGHTLALQHSGQTTFSLCLVKRVIVMLWCAVNVGTYFQYFPWSLSAQFVFRKRYFIILKITFWSCNHFKKMVRLWKTK